MILLVLISFIFFTNCVYGNHIVTKTRVHPYHMPIKYIFHKSPISRQLTPVVHPHKPSRKNGRIHVEYTRQSLRQSPTTPDSTTITTKTTNTTSNDPTGRPPPSQTSQGLTSPPPTSVPVMPSTTFKVLGSNGCAGNVSMIGNTVFFTSVTSTPGNTATCTVIFGVQNGQSVKDLTFIHNIDMLLARKVQHWCYLDPGTRSYCIRYISYYVYERCDNCIYTKMGNQYFTSTFEASYSGCGMNNNPDPITYTPQGDAQVSWRNTETIRHHFNPSCESEDSISVTVSLSTTEAGGSLGGGWDYESSTYISEHTLSLSKAGSGAFLSPGSVSFMVMVMIFFIVF